MTKNFQIQLSWKDPVTGGHRNPYLSLPIALGREFSEMPAKLEGNQVARMVLKSNQISDYHTLIDLEQNHLVVIDQNTTNGILVNGERQTRCILRNGDILQIGFCTITVTFDPLASLEDSTNNTSIPSHHLSLTEIFPVISNKLDLHKSDFLIPGIITVLFVVAMLATRNSEKFFYILAAYLAGASHYFIHKICHKHKPWWLLVSVGLATGLPLLGGLHLFSSHTEDDFVEIVIKTFLGQGLSQEIFKAFPVILVYLIARFLSSPKREMIGIWEPIDGILLGTASATGFALVETMMHVHEEIEKSGNFAGLTLLIPQILGDISGQVAYSGYFGYFIGLSTLKKAWRWQLLGIGWVTTATIHALGSILTVLQEKQQQKFLASMCLALISSIAYIFLIAAILKARQLSPKLHKSSTSHY